MLAIDTNILVRYLTGDHPRQSARARALVDTHDIYVRDTVILESEWVLRGVYGYAPDQIFRALKAFAGLAQVSIESPARVAQALDLAERGMDFADALHIGGSDACEAFVTFDKKLIKAARTAGIDSIREP